MDKKFAIAMAEYERLKKINSAFSFFLSKKERQEKISLYSSVVEHIKSLEEKYGSLLARQTISFHVFSGSTIPEEEIGKMVEVDFPGEDSLEEYFKGMLK